ncbi:MAG: putative short-subunit dehydrogenase-like oxidoreductase (DUF2520 family) [Planctomycetota bacterium]|jgi:predicted short-subunit dehydrogenase-like oxidoreductase (DUF2520 family)
MALRIAIVGPGRVGIAFARRFVRAGVHVLGFVGRDRARTESCIEGLDVDLSKFGQLKPDQAKPDQAKLRVLTWPDVHTAHVVIFAVGDEQLSSAIEAAVAVGGRPCSLWLHTSGRHGLDVFAKAQSLGVRIGALHPLLPFSGSVETQSMQGALALLLGEPRSLRLLHRLCAQLELQPIVCAAIGAAEGGVSNHNRPLYHAACALAANGATSLFGLASDLLQRAGGIASEDCDRIVASLMHAAAAASEQHGAGKALSGPVRRGDAQTVAAHLIALNAEAKTAVPAYVALMNGALLLARDQGLAPVDCERIASALSLLRPSS